ncbi:MAG: transporter substrate-binding domain-containing protein [Nitrospirae bacterium]|nr:transporter substrate-binding domain-containing protein [Nitrospirota bacterium]
MMEISMRNLRAFLVVLLVFACGLPLEQTVSAMPNDGSVRIELTDEERKFLSGKQLRLGVDANRPPFEYIDEQGRYVGMSADFIMELAKRIGVTIVVQKDVKWTQALEKSKTGEIDAIPKITPTEERRKFLLFTKVYTTNPSVIVTLKERNIHGIDDLNGLKVGVVKGLVIEARLKKEHPDLSLVQLPDIATALQELSAGKFDAFIDNLGTVAYNIDKIGLTNLKIAASTPYIHDLAIGVRKDWPLLVSALDKALASMTEQEKRQIKSRWIVVKYQAGVDWVKVVPVVVGLLGVIGFFIQWNRRLRQAVLQRERAERELKDYTSRIEFNSLLKSHIASLSTDLQTSLSMQEFSQRLMNHIVPLIKAGYGTLYVLDRDEGILSAAGGYGGEYDNQGSHFALGQGLVGQCARDKLPININAPTEDYLHITCGVGKLRPVCVTLQPVIHTDNVLGVIELAGVSPFVNDYQTMMDELMPVIAMNLVIIVRNLHTQHLMEVTRKQKEQYRALFEYTQDAIMTLAPPQWMFTSANPATLNLFRVSSEEEFTRLGPWDISPEYQADGQPSSVMAQQVISMAMEQGYSSFEWTHKTIDGKEFPATVILTRVELGDSVFLQATVRDITQQKQTAEALMRSKQEIETRNRNFQEIFQSSPIGIGISTGGVLRYCNHIFTQWTNLTPGETAFKAYVNPDDRAMLVRILERDGIVRDYRLQMYSAKYGVMDLLVTYMRIRYEGEEAILGWLVNTSSLKKNNEINQTDKTERMSGEGGI